MMMAAHRSAHSFRAALFLFVLIGIPSVARSSTLEDAAKELAGKIAAVLPPGENVSCEIRNLSSLKGSETARIEQAIKVELQERGIGLSGSGTATIVLVTLAENYENFVWTGEIHEGDATHVVLIPVERSAENRAFSGALPVTIHSQKFWEGPEHILDAGEISNGAGKFWRILLLPTGLLIQDMQTGSSRTLEISSNQSASRDPWGNLSYGPIGNTITFFLAPGVCTVNLETPDLKGCLPEEGSAARTDGQPRLGDIRHCSSGPAATRQRHRNRNAIRLRRCKSVFGYRGARLYANGYIASVPDGFQRRRRGQQRIGFSRTDHGIARCVRHSPGCRAESRYWKL